jgi:hypothetical protein
MLYIFSGVYVGWNLYNNATIKLADGTWDNLDNLLDGYCQFTNMQVVDEKSFCRRWKCVKDNHKLGEGGVGCVDDRMAFVPFVGTFSIIYFQVSIKK